MTEMDATPSAEELAAFRAWKESTSAAPPAQRGKGKGAAGGNEKMSEHAFDEKIARSNGVD